MKVLLTGATGFVGKNISSILAREHSVVPIGSNVWDLTNQASCQRMLEQIQPDTIVHAAGSVGGIGANQNNPGKFMYENLIMGANLIHCAMEHKIGKFILLGTVCSYPKFTEIPFKESDMWKGYPEETNAPYGIAKKTLMKLLETYYEQYGLCGVNLVPVNMYGPQDHFNDTTSHVIPALMVKINQAKISNTPIRVWGTGQASREFLYVQDLGEAINLAIKADLTPEPINIGTGDEIRIYDLVTMLCEIMEFDGEVIYQTDKPDGQPRRCLDTTTAKKLLGFEATTKLRDGLEKTVEWYWG